MNNIVNLKEIMDAVKSMSDDVKKSLVEQIMAMMSGKENVISLDEETCSQMIGASFAERPDCPHCKASGKMGFINKRGFKNGAQRYHCKACGKTFVPSTNTAFERTHKSADVWRKFIEMTISEKSILACSIECGICYQTAFTWRHKVLNAFRVHQSSVVMNGNVEMDEMLIPLSYKGNHVKGGFHERRVKLPDVDNGLPRESFKRGTDNKALSSKQKACVVCLVENGDKTYLGAVPGVGFMQPSMLEKVVGKHINKESALMLVDQYRITINYLEQNQYRYVKLSSNVSENPNDHKPEIIGQLHLQHVNALHRHIRRFLAGYCGVSSKYLENYISLFMWLKNLKAKKQDKKVESTSIKRMAMSDCYISKKTLLAFPAIPECA